MSWAPEGLEPGRPVGCLSEYALERLRLGELVGDSRETARAHVGFCARCSAIADQLAGAAASLPPRRPSAEHPRRLRRLRLGAAGGALAVAAACLIVWARLGPGDEGAGEVRLKGGVRLGFFVRHREQVRPGLPGERVAAGDALRFTVTTPKPGWVAVLSRDGAGRGSIYYPTDGRAMVPIAARGDQPLPASTVLDEVAGPERICALVCSAPLELEPLRRGFEAEASAPGGCAADCVTIEKAAGRP